MKRIVITGSKGLLGWHTAVRLHARNCELNFIGKKSLYEIILLDRSKFNNYEFLLKSIESADLIFHFAGVNRSKKKDFVGKSNILIAQNLSKAYIESGSKAHIIYANSTQSFQKTEYGLSKKVSGQILGEVAFKFTNIFIPNVFGECAKPFFNNVTATLIYQIWQDKSLSINPKGIVNLIYAGDVAQKFIDIGLDSKEGNFELHGKKITVNNLSVLLKEFHTKYQKNIFPELKSVFDLNLFNSYRGASFPLNWPKELKLNEDYRGSLFEAAKGGGGQSYISTTKPGIIRGEHFHLNKVERFIVLNGTALIRTRKVFDEQIVNFRVSGDYPVYIDLPTMYTHSIENIGTNDLLTYFWSHDIFDPKSPDTYKDPVLKKF